MNCFIKSRRHRYYEGLRVDNADLAQREVNQKELDLSVVFSVGKQWRNGRPPGEGS